MADLQIRQTCIGQTSSVNPTACCSDSPGSFRGVLDFVGGERPPQDFALLVEEPFLEHLVAAQLAVPCADGDIPPECGIVDVDVERGFANGA